MTRPTLVVSRRLPEDVEQALKARFDVRLNLDDHPFSPSELTAALDEADALLVTVTDRLDAAVLSAGKGADSSTGDDKQPRVRIIANFGVGYNHIDLSAARSRGIVVTNTPDVLTDCTADIALMLMLMVARRAGEGERLVRSSQWAGWCPTQLMGTRLSNKTLGIIGMGRIGQAVARRARRARHGFGMRIVCFNRSPLDPALLADLDVRQYASIDEVLATADFVSLHCPGGGENRHMIDARRLALMQPHAFLINTARGDVVDEAALTAALAARQFAGAGLDVFESEPNIAPGLLTLDNVVLLPHLGSATRETRVAMGMRALANLEAFFDGQPPPDRVV